MARPGSHRVPSHTGRRPGWDHVLARKLVLDKQLPRLRAIQHRRRTRKTFRIDRGRQPLPRHRHEPFSAVPSEYPLEITARRDEVSATVQQDSLQLGDPGLGGSRHRLRFRYPALHGLRCPAPLRLQLFGLELLKRTHRRSSLPKLILFRGPRRLRSLPLPRERCLLLLLLRRFRRLLSPPLLQLAVVLRLLTLRV